AEGIEPLQLGPQSGARGNQPVEPDHRGGVLLVGEQLGDLLVNTCGMIHRRTPGRGGEWNGGKGESFGDVPGSSAPTATATTHQRRAGSTARRHAGGGG